MVAIFRTSYRSALWLLAALIACLLAAPAAAQVGGGGEGGPEPTTKMINTPAEKFAVAPGGVDMRTGRYGYSRTDLSIGNLALTRIMATDVKGHINPFGNLSHNWDIMITEKRINILEGKDEHGSGQDFQINVHFGGRSDTFRARVNDTGYVQMSKGAYAMLGYPEDADKAGPGIVYTFQAADGTIAVFRPLGNADCSNYYRCAYVSSVTEPDGTKFTFEYDNPSPGIANDALLRSVTSSQGYALLIEQSVGNPISKACVINLAVTAKPSNNVCPAGAPATVTYGYSGARLASVTDPSGRVSGFTYGTTSGGAATMGFTKPDPVTGQQTAWLTNTLAGAQDEERVVQEIVVGQSFAGGQSYTYEFDYTPQVDGQVSTIAGGSFTDALGNLTSVKYDFPILPSTSPGGPCYTQFCTGVNVGDIVYQATSGPVTITDPLNRVSTSDYCDPQIKATLPPLMLNKCVVTDLVSWKDAGGVETFVTYGAFRNITQVRRKAVHIAGLADPPDIVTSATYACINFKSCDKPATVTDANQNTTTYTYSPDHGGILTRTGPAVQTRQPGGSFASVSPQTRYTYAQRFAWIKNSSGAYVQAATPVWLLTQESFCRVGPASGGGCSLANDEVVTAYDYGPDSGPNTLLLRGKAITADGATLRTCYGYDPGGQKVSETLPRAGLSSCSGVPPAAAADFTTVSRFDAAGRLLGTIGPDPDALLGPVYTLNYPATRNSYDNVGRLVKVERGELATWQGDSILPANWTGFTIYKTIDTAYDALDRKVKESASGGGITSSVTQYSYDVGGRLLCTAVRMNPAVFTSLPTSACALGTEGSLGPDRISRNEYDAAGQLLTATLAYGTSDASVERTNGYTATGQLATLTDAENNRTTYEYDGQDRLVKTRFPVLAQGANASSTTDVEQYGHDPNGNRTSFTKRDGSLLGFTFDALNRMTVKVVPERAAPGPQHLDAAQTRDVHYAYDLRNLQTEAKFDSLSGEGLLSEYDGFGRLTKSTTAMGGNSRYLTYQYDPDGNRTRLTFQDGNYIASQYDGLDRPVWIRENGVERLGLIYYHPHGGRKIFHRNGTSTTYYYDAALRLSQLYIGYQPSPANRVDNWLSYNPASQIVTDIRNNDAYAWNAHYNADRNYSTNGLNQYIAAGTTGFQYDANGNLIQSGDKTYVYDIENRMVGAAGGITLTYDPMGRLFQITGGTAGTTQFLYDGDKLVAEYGASNNILRRYAHGPGVDEPIAWYEGAGFGANRQRLQEDRHASIVSVTDSAGNLSAINTYDEYGIPAATNIGRFQYTGQAWLDELGMYHYKARIYSPTLGRFMQTDPIGYEDQMNLYAYVRNDPVNAADPKGLFAFEVGTAADAAVLEDQVNSIAKGVYRFDSDNRLQRVGDYTGDGQRSQTFADELDKGIADPDVAQIDVNQTINWGGVRQDVDAVYNGGVTFPGDGGQTRSNTIVSGHGANNVRAEGGGTLSQSPAQVTMHELVVHAIPNIVSPGAPQSLVVENKIRDELDLPRRATDGDHPN